MGDAGRKRGMAGSVRTVVAVHTALLLAWLAGASPAAASWSEGGWINSGGSARTPSTPVFATDGTTQWRLIRGEDNGLWISRNNGPASRMNISGGSAGLTYVAPEIIAAQGHLYAFHTGTDHQVYYSFTLSGNNESQWSSWRAIPGFANTNMSPSVTITNTRGTQLGVFITRANGHVAGIQMDILAWADPLFTSGWVEEANGVFLSRPDVTSGYNPYSGRVEIMAVATGADHRVWSVFSDGTPNTGIGTVPVSSGGVAGAISGSHGPQRLGGAAAAGVSSFAPSIARGGRDDRLSITHGWEMEQEQERGITITSSAIAINTPVVWVARSSDGGHSLSDWSMTINQSVHTDTTPGIHGYRDAIFAAATLSDPTTLNGASVPSHSIVEKRL
ncbi:hypothetical protein [Streptomyces sp. NPDC088789]|uniref:hypothetical protein n=1 Tax=Streptomyces sp. NPDC088789 TaxID=3365899 RepID=UPI00382F111A